MSTTNNSTVLTKASKDLASSVNSRINAMASSGELMVAPNYSPANSIKFAVLQIQNNSSLAKCTDASKANALLSMVVQGLNPVKSQCYFVPYGNEVNLQTSYFGKMALAMRTGKIVAPPKAQVIYADDIFEYEVDSNTGNMRVVKHEQRLQNIDNSKIIGAYAITRFVDGTTDVTIMNIKQIEQAWMQGATKGKSGAHTNFREEMAKKSVIGRALKNVINSSDDAYLFDGQNDNETDPEMPKNNMVDFDEAEFAEVEEPTPSTPEEATSAPIEDNPF